MCEASRRWRVDAACATWLIFLAAALLAPVLMHGGISGPLDILSKFGLNAQPDVTVHNRITQDQASEIIPWMTLAWSQVHAGHIPLWNSASGLGMPLAFNWQSAVFGLPSLVGYVFPLRYDPTIQMLVTLAVAGTGVYAFCRSLGMRTLACVFAATAFELSGPMVAWLGWPVASVASWTGWLCAAAMLVARGRRRARSIALFAFALAQMILAGQLDMLIVTLACLAVFGALVVVLRTVKSGRAGAATRPLIDLAIASMCGLGLAAPLVLPGVQLARSSVRSGRSTDTALPIHDLTHVLFAAFDGSTVTGHEWFGDFLGFYPNGAAYVGVFVLVLTGVALATRWRSATVKALSGLVLVGIGLAFAPTAVAAAKSIPLLGPVQWSRGLVFAVFALTVLSGFGLDALIAEIRGRSATIAAALGFAAAALVLLTIWLFGRGHLNPSDSSTRAWSFAWPAAQCAVGLILVGWLLARPGSSSSVTQFHRKQVVGVVLIVTESVFLVTSGSSFATPTRQLIPTTPALTALHRLVGSSLVGIGAGSCLPFGGPISVGILPEANDLYGLNEFSIYDPILPKRYYTSWALVSGTPAKRPPASIFCPPITTLREARVYGIGFVLEPRGAAGPLGGQLVTAVGSEQLFRMPGTSLATLTPASHRSVRLPVDAVGQSVPVAEPSPGHWVIRTNSPKAGVFRLRVTGVPGMRASIDGHPLALESYADLMVQAWIPKGAHTIDVSYRPQLFTLGVIVASVTLVGLASTVAWTERRPRRGSSEHGAASDGDEVASVAGYPRHEVVIATAESDDTGNGASVDRPLQSI